MNWLRNLLAAWRTKRTRGIRRVVVLKLVGLDLSRVDQYLAEGLLHYLALLGDIGSRARLEGANVLDVVSVAENLRFHGLRAIALANVPPASPVDLDRLCVADRAQQEQLICVLQRRQPCVVLCEFDMLVQLGLLFGPEPDADQQLILRDVYARMDEIVGKALSFVDEATALLVVVPPQPQSLHADISAQKCELFASCRLVPADIRNGGLVPIVLGLLTSGRVPK